MVCSFVVSLPLNADLGCFFPAVHCGISKHWVLHFIQTRDSLRPIWLVYLGSAILQCQIKVTIKKCLNTVAAVNRIHSKCLTRMEEEHQAHIKSSIEAEDMAHSAR